MRQSGGGIDQLGRDDLASLAVDRDLELLRLEPGDRLTAAVHDLHIHGDEFDTRPESRRLLLLRACGRMHEDSGNDGDAQDTGS